MSWVAVLEGKRWVSLKWMTDEGPMDYRPSLTGASMPESIEESWVIFRLRSADGLLSPPPGGTPNHVWYGVSEPSSGLLSLRELVIVAPLSGASGLDPSRSIPYQLTPETAAVELVCCQLLSGPAQNVSAASVSGSEGCVTVVA